MNSMMWIAPDPRAISGALGVIALALNLTACEHFARGPGAPGAAPIEHPSPIAPAPNASLPDPCRGLALPSSGVFIAPGMYASVVATQQGDGRDAPG